MNSINLWLHKKKSYSKYGVLPVCMLSQNRKLDTKLMLQMQTQ